MEEDLSEQEEGMMAVFGLFLTEKSGTTKKKKKKILFGFYLHLLSCTSVGSLLEWLHFIPRHNSQSHDSGVVGFPH